MIYGKDMDWTLFFRPTRIKYLIAGNLAVGLYLILWTRTLPPQVDFLQLRFLVDVALYPLLYLPIALYNLIAFTSLNSGQASSPLLARVFAIGFDLIIFYLIGCGVSHLLYKRG